MCTHKKNAVCGGFVPVYITKIHEVAEEEVVSCKLINKV